MTATDFAMPVLGGHRVLVVENDPDTAASLTAALRLNGFDAHAARTAAAAVAAVTATHPRVVIATLDLPDADACDAIRRFRAMTDPPVVFVLTGHSDRGHRRAAADAGAAEYLLKPADTKALVRLIRTACHAAPA